VVTKPPVFITKIHYAIEVPDRFDIVILEKNFNIPKAFGCSQKGGYSLSGCSVNSDIKM